MAMFDIITKSAELTSDSRVNLSGEIDSLDKTRIDAVCAFFEYGTNADLSDGARISGEFDSGMFQTGIYTYEWSGLSSDTTYYYQARGRAIRYDDPESATYINSIPSLGFLEDLANNLSELQNARVGGFFECAGIKDAILKNTIRSAYETAEGKTALLFGSYTLTDLFDVADHCTWFFDSFDSENGSFDVNSDTPDGNGKSLHYHLNNGTVGRTYEVDLTDVSELEIKTKLQDDTIDEAIRVRIDGNTIWYTDNTHGWTTRTIDLSEYTGNHTLELGGWMDASNSAFSCNGYFIDLVFK